MSNLTKAILVMATIGCFLRLGWWAAEQIEVHEVIYQCGFEKIDGTFTATERELQGDSQLITVQRGERTFMFRRTWLMGCVDSLSGSEEQS